MQSSYAKAINHQEGRQGSLFRQKVKHKALANNYYARICFHYIHQNPLRACLVSRLEAWPYSSFQDYAGLRKGTLCHQQQAVTYLDLDIQCLVEESYQVIDDKILRHLW